MDILGIFRALDRLSVLLLGLALLISLYCEIRIFKERRGMPYLKALNVLFIMFAIYGLLYMFLGDNIMVQREWQYVNKRSYIKDIATSLLPIFAFYYLSLKGYLSENKMKIWIMVIFVLSYFVFFTRQREALEHAFLNLGYEVENTTINASYLILNLFPALVLFKDKKVLFYVGLAFCIALILMGAKRGAIIVSAVCAVVLLFGEVKNSSRNKKILVFAASAVFVYLGWYFVKDYYLANTYLQTRVEDAMEGNTSSRNFIWLNLIDYYFSQNNPIHILFGLGANGTLTIGENYAHNDWLEILINQGAVGFFIYLYYWITLFKIWRKSKKMPMAYMALTQIVIILFLRSFMSMSYGSIHYPLSMVFGYYLAQIKLNANTSHN